MKHLIKYLFRRSVRDKLPPLKHSLTDDIDPLELDRELELILMTGRVRDIHEARRLMDKYQATSAVELLKKLPPRPPVDWRGRFRRWLAQLEGAYINDPYQSELRKHKADSSPVENRTMLG